MAAARSDKAPDPLGKRALFWVPTAGQPVSDDVVSGLAVALPVGKRALYSGAGLDADSLVVTSGNPLDGRGNFTVVCGRCRQTSHVGVLDMLIFQLPLGVWLPRGRFDHRMTCPACRRRSWCSVTLRRS